MLYYNIVPSAFPEVVFAHSLTQKNYNRGDSVRQSHLEITYIKSGALRLVVQNTEYIIEEGSFLILCHSMPFSLRTVKDDVHIHYTVAIDIGSNITLNNDTRILENQQKGTVTVPLFIPQCSKTDDCIKQLNNIIKTYHAPEMCSNIKAALMACNLLCDLANTTDSPSSVSIEAPYHSQSVYSDRIKSYIHSHLTSDISLSDIAAAIGKSPNYLNHVFKEINDITIIQYINLERTKKAAELILKKQYSLKQAAEQVGVHDANYLSRMFKKQFGVSVSEFKNNSLESTYSMIDPKKEVF